MSFCKRFKKMCNLEKKEQLMIMDIMDGLEAVGFPTKETDLEKALENGVTSIDFTNLVAWLSKQLQLLLELEAIINPILDPSESDSFLLETSSFLKELSCPHSCLIEGTINERLGSTQSRLILLYFLISELRAAHILHKRNKWKKNALEIQMTQSDTAKNLSEVVQILGLKVDTSNTNEMFQAIIDAVNSKSTQSFRPLLQGHLTPEQWETIEILYSDLCIEYRGRKEMMLRRLDVTLASFQWGKDSRVKDKLQNIMQSHRNQLKTETLVEMSDLLSASDDLLIMEKTSSSDVVRSASIHKVVMGEVPDRGGRPKEQRPPVEMPGFSRRIDGGRGGGGGRGGFRGRGGGGGGYGRQGGDKRW